MYMYMNLTTKILHYMISLKPAKQRKQQNNNNLVPTFRPGCTGLLQGTVWHSGLVSLYILTLYVGPCAESSSLTGSCDVEVLSHIDLARTCG